MRHLLILLLAAAPALAQTQTGFGGAAASDGQTIYVGESGGVYQPGAVHAFEAGPDGVLRLQRTITAPDARNADGFGRAIAVSDDVVLIGSPAATAEAGAAFVFDRDTNGVLVEAARLQVGTPVETGFGSSVALGGDYAIVGAPTQQSGQGAAYVFSRSGSGYVLSALLGAPVVMPSADGNLGEGRFGTAVATNGDHVVIASPRAGEGGMLYIYRRGAAGWTLEQAVAGTDGEMIGSALAFFDGGLAVGAPGANARAGAVYVYRAQSDGRMMRAQTITPDEAAPSERFGSSLAFTPQGTLWVGAPAAGSGMGAAYHFAPSGGDWTQAQRVTADMERSMTGYALAATDRILVAGAPGADFGSGLVVPFGLQGDAYVAQAPLMPEPAGLTRSFGDPVRCEEGRASYFDCDGVDMLAFMPLSELGGLRGARLNDIWGWTDPTTGKEYALVGRMDGMSAVDVSTPERPVLIANLPLTPGANPSSWRDIKVYRDHAFITADGAGDHGMQVLDLTVLRSFSGDVLQLEPTFLYTNVASAHNMVINEDTGMGFIVGAQGGGETCGGGLHMVDLRTPASPTFLGCYADPQTGRRGTGYTHDAQCVTYNGPDTRYQGREVCFASNETALLIGDVTDKSNPVTLSIAEYPRVAYTHQGWLTEDHRFHYVNDELDEMGGQTEETRTLVWDVSDLEDPQLVQEYTYGTTSIDHNLYVRDNLLYMANYASGLRIHDVSDPANPRPVAHFDTTPVEETEPGFTGLWSNYPFFGSGIVVVSSIGEGLFVLKKSDEAL
jgi:choice-of-anchor B domain-containing protein